MARLHNYLLPLLGTILLGAVALREARTSRQTLGALSVQERISGRAFPSVFQAWNPADNLKGEDPLTTAARHDLIFHGPGFFGLKWNNAAEGLATGFTAESAPNALRMRQTLLAKNPRLILLAEIRYRDAPRGFLPESHPWWKRDKQGKFVMGWAEGGFIQLDIANPDYQRQVALRAGAAVASGAVDGVMLDWWKDDDAHLALVKRVRAAIGENALLLVNSNDAKIPKTAPYVNGLYMECYRSKTVEDWNRIAETLAWAEANLRPPHIDCLETWFHVSRNDLNLMRATTCLALTLSDGYCLFADPDDLPTPDHLHNWYPFWEKTLGRPVAAGSRQEDGTIRREFEKGTVVYNPMGRKPCHVSFPEARLRVATGTKAADFLLDAPDGDIFLKIVPEDSDKK